MELFKTARNAMATRFEVLLWGEKPVSLRAAAEEALDEIERLDGMLSLYKPGSEIRRLNECGADAWVRLSPEVFGLLQRAKILAAETGWTFDVTLAPLIRCWGFMSGSGEMPSPEDLEAARDRVGSAHLLLDEARYSARFERPGMMVDLGAIGKGYALDEAAERLRDAGVSRGLIHGGTSTVIGIGAPPDEKGWKVAVDHPDTPPGGRVGEAEALPPVGLVWLKDEALSVSGVRGKAFESGGRVYGHVIDPRTGAPVDGAMLAAVVLPSAEETDALSTALLVEGLAGRPMVERLRGGMRTLVAGRRPDDTRLVVEANGIQLCGV